MQKLLRKFIGFLADFTPNTVYYAKGWPAEVNNLVRKIEAKKNSKGTAMTAGAVALCCAMHESLPNVGDTATITLTGVTRGSEDVGHFEVVAKRINER